MYIFAFKKDLHNFKRKLDPLSQLKDQSTILYQEDLDSVKLRVNDTNEIECIFIQIRFMRQWFINPHEVRNIDTTFKLKKENFLLHISLVANEHSKCVPTAYSFLKSSSTENLEFFYECLSGKKFLEVGSVEIIDPDLAS